MTHVKRMVIAGALGASVFFAPVEAQQQPPATEVFYATVSSERGIESIVNISNNPGYDNQPSFLPDGSAILFSSNRDGKQTDIYRYDIATKALTQLTKTPEAEYSPTVTPDRTTFSVIRVEADGTQRLWRFDLDGSNPRLVLENVKPVGYHVWLDATRLALFILGSGGGSPATLQMADTTTGKAEAVATGIGRTLALRQKTGALTFMTTGGARMLHEFDPKTGRTQPLTSPLEGSQDAVWLPSGVLLMARGTMISGWTAARKEWFPIMDVATLPAGSPAIQNITRMAARPDGFALAIVGELPRK